MIASQVAKPRLMNRTEHQTATTAATRFLPDSNHGQLAPSTRPDPIRHQFHNLKLELFRKLPSHLRFLGHELIFVSAKPAAAHFLTLFVAWLRR